MRETICLNPGCKNIVPYYEEKLKKGWIELTCPNCKLDQLIFKCKNGNCNALFQIARNELEKINDTKSIRCTKCNCFNNINIKDFNQTVINPNKVYPFAYSSPGKLKIFKKNNELTDPITISLRPGENTLGRKAESLKTPDSQSPTIYITTRDAYMSRNHIKIRVMLDKTGNFKHYLSDLKSVNGTIHNDGRLQEGEETILTHNDTIKIGKTIIHFIQDQPE